MRPPVLPGLIGLLAATAAVLAKDLPGVNSDAILRDLQQIETRQKAAQISNFQNTLSMLRAAAASQRAASDLYEKAVEAVEYEGRDNKVAQFAEWKAGMAEALRSNEAETALMMHLAYLVMSLERGASDDPAMFAAPSLAYAQRLPAVEGAFRMLDDHEKSDRKNADTIRKVQNLKKEFLDQPLNNALFVRWMRLGPWLPKGDGWEMSPGNLSGILEKNVRPSLREQKSPQLPATWDIEMQVLADRATAGDLSRLADEFNLIARPRLQFNKANDLIVIGQAAHGVTEIYAIAKANPQHPNFSKWAARLRELLTASAPAPTATAPAAPETPPTP